MFSFLSASSSLPTAQPLDEKPSGGSGYISFWKPQVTSALETASPSLHLSSAHVFPSLSVCEHDAGTCTWLGSAQKRV